MAEQWYYMRDGQQVGPISIGELRAAAGRGEITSQSYVWNEQMTDWTPAGQVGGLLTPSGSGQQSDPGQPQQVVPDNYAQPGLGENAPGAVASLVIGIFGLCTCPLVGGILSLVFANQALSAIRERPGVYQGKGMAQAGMVLGVVQLLEVVLFFALNVFNWALLSSP